MSDSEDDDSSLRSKKSKPSKPLPKPPAFPDKPSRAKEVGVPVTQQLVRYRQQQQPRTNRVQQPRTSQEQDQQPGTSRGLPKQPVYHSRTQQQPGSNLDLPRVQQSDQRDQVIRLLMDIKTQVMQNATLIRSLINTTEHEEVEDAGEVIELLPCQTLQQLNDCNEQLQSRRKKKQMIRYLGNLGGASEKEVIKRIMEAVFSHELAVQLNWKGTGNKTGIQTMIISCVICRAARASWNASTNASAEEVIKKWLKYSMDRNGGRKERENKKKAVAAEAPVAAEAQRDDATEKDDSASSSASEADAEDD